MSSGQKDREDLFHHHSENLKSISPKASDVFVCPICFRVFTPEDLDDQKTEEDRRLRIGHVWPKYFRALSDRARGQTVLLCKRCNDKAGSLGDAMMQRHEILSAAHKTGKLNEPRLVEIVPPHPYKWTEEPAYIRAIVEVSDEDGKGLLITPVAKQTNPKELKKFDHYTSQGPSSIIVFPIKVREQFVPFVQVGWLTSAYLLSFYTLGYRFVFQASHDPIRKYIMSSFEKEVDNRLYFQESQTLGFSPCKTHFNEHPEIDLVLLTFQEEVSPHIEVSFLRYHVRLPVQLAGIPLTMPDQFTLPEDARCIATRLSQYSAHAHSCPWDTILGEPDYYVEGQTINTIDTQ